jgi:Concanavalin A-like lectin/glucanases superfamily
MPISAGTNIILRSGQDADALAYFARAGIASGTQTPTSYDNAGRFNGTNQFLSCASNSTLQLGGTDFTISFWANASTAGYIIGGDRSGAVGNGYAVRWSGSGFQFLYNDGSAWQLLSIMTATPNTWHFVTYTLTGSTMRRYLNGSLVGTETLAVAVQNLNGSTFYLATDNSTQSFGGSLANTAIWKRALTASEVTALFNNGAGRTYASLDTGLRTNLISWWALNGTSSAVSLTDSHGVVTGTPNNLTNNGTPLVTAPNIGPIITGYSDSRRLISDFVRGIKSLGLWNQMVCWPLRASQNASTTLTARSLGGLGTFDGSLFGLATSAWGANGLAISNPSVGSNSQRIDLASGIGTGGANIYSYGAGMITSSANFNRIIQIENAAANTRNPFTSYGYLGGAQQFLQADLMSGSNTQVSALQNNATIPLNAFGSMSAGVVGNTLTAYNNTTAGPTATSPGGWSAPPGETTRSLGVSYNGTLSMVVIGRFEASASLVTSLNNLYKQTLLLGLGLP